MKILRGYSMPNAALQICNDTSWERFNQTDFGFTQYFTVSLPSLVVCLLGLAGNGVVFWCLSFRITRNSITVYILNLAVADFALLFSFLFGLLFVLLEASEVEVLTALNGFVFTLEALAIFGYNTSLLLLMTISIERCIAVVYPIWYKCQRPNHLSSIVCCFLSVFSLLETMLELFFCAQFPCTKVLPSCREVLVFLSLMSFGIISPFMILSSLILMFQVKRKSINRQPKRLYRAVLLNVHIFLICTFPIRLILLLARYQAIIVNKAENFALIQVHFFLSTINSSANPFIYFLLGSNKTRSSGGFIMEALRRVFGGDTEGPSQDSKISNIVSAGPGN